MKHFKNIQNIGEFYNADLKHPFIYIVNYKDAKNDNLIKNEPIVLGFYKISFVRNFNGFIQIGSTKYSGKNGVLHFVEPNQEYTCNSTNPWEGFEIVIHPNIFKEFFRKKK